MAPDRSAPLPPTLDAGVRAFLDGSPAATIAIRLDGRVAYANPAYATLIGEPDPAALADRSIGFGTWHDGAAALAACRATQAQGAWQGPLTARHRDGTPVPVSCAARMLADADGREDTLLITLLPRTDAAPQPPSPGDDASLMQAVVGAAGVLIVVVDAAGRIVRVNGECERVSGWRGDELAGRPIRESIVSESSARDAREAFSRMLSPDGPGRIDGVRTELRDRSGASRSVEWTCTRLGGPREPHRYVIAVGIDLTARRAAEQALARSRTEVAQFRQLIERTSFEVWMLGADARIRYVNAAAAASLGYPADALVGRSIADIDADGPARVEAIFDRVVQAMVRGEAVEFEVEHLARDGRRVRKAVRAMLIERDGETVGAMFAQDITERTRALAARAAHERTLHATLDLFPGWVACIDDDGRYVYANERFLDDRGLTREKVIGQSIEDVRGPLKSSRVRPLMARALAGEKFAMERRFFDTRGEQRFYWMTFDAQHDVPVPGRNLYFTFGVDVTDARRNELRLKSILQATRIATWEWSARNGELKVNPQFAELGGRHFDGETVVESMVEVFQTYVHPDDRPLRRKRFASLVSGTTEGFEHEFRIRHADGSWVWLHERANVVARSESGEPLLLIGTLLDVTARKRQEEELQELNAALEARVADRTSALAAATERAERASAAKTEFLSRMSHELRTPLNAILGFSQLLGMGPLPDAQAGTVAEILGAGRHLLALIDEVLDLATVESGGVSLRLEPTAPGPLVDECLALVAPDARRAALEVDNRIGPDCPALLADRMRLRQVVLNLLTNAVKYNRPGGRVTVAARVVGAEGCELRVSDQGLGLAPAQVARLFRPFERLDAKRGSIPGTGIGLAVSKRLVELMGGSIGVDSAVGSGSTFWVRLPAAPAVTPGPVSESAPAPGPACAPGSPARACRRVLYVEDNTSNQRLMRDLLTLRGDVELETVGDPRTAVERARAFRPELVLLDIQLPYVDGYRVLQGLRAGGVDAPVVAVSANAMPEDVARGEAAGFAAYLTKPLDVRRVLEVVAAHLDR